MYYQVKNNQHAKTLVLLHSGGMAGVEWQPQIDSLAKHFNLLIPDLPGHGQSLLAKGETLSISLMADAVVNMLTTEGIQIAHILGSSMGGAVALWIALNYPEYVDKLVIYRIGYTKTAATFSQTQDMANPNYWRQYGLHNWLSKLHSPQGDKSSWEEVIANVSRVLEPRTSEHNHQLNDLARIQATTLLIAGDRDPLIPLPTLLSMFEMIPHSAVWVLPNASHITATNTWRSGIFVEEITRFLKTK
ncbi:MAG: alpha/beta fold hydrolase [Ostreibacterium sp.]